jgi:hypothetical protein
MDEFRDPFKGMSLIPSAITCPRCEARGLGVRTRSHREIMWKGVVCPNCRCECTESPLYWRGSIGLPVRTKVKEQKLSEGVTGQHTAPSGTPEVTKAYNNEITESIPAS